MHVREAPEELAQRGAEDVEREVLERAARADRRAADGAGEEVRAVLLVVVPAPGTQLFLESGDQNHSETTEC